MSKHARIPVAAAVAAAIALVAARPGEAEPQDPSAGVTVVRRCVVEFDRNTTVSPTIFGLLKDCLVEPGTRVKAGQVLGRLQDDEVVAEVRLRELEAASDVEVRLGEAKSAQATSKMQRTGSLVLRNAASKEEYHIHQLEAAAGALEVEQARHRRRVAGVQLEHARAVLRTRELVSPHDGVVVTVARRQGETVAPRDPVFQVVDTDRLRVVGQVDVAEVWRLKVGQAARVIPEVAGADLPVEHQVFPARLAFIDSQIDPATRTCKVHVLAENRDGLLRAGLEARVEFDPEPPPVAPATRTAGRP